MFEVNESQVEFAVVDHEDLSTEETKEFTTMIPINIRTMTVTRVPIIPRNFLSPVFGYKTVSNSDVLTLVQEYSGTSYFGFCSFKQTKTLNRTLD